MRKALQLAARGRGWTSPNPMVGAVVVQEDTIVGTGYHERVGGPHAEINALRAAGKQARNGTLYVTLEPCNHFGRTPPCTQAILKAGITRVVIGMTDPNPHVEGSGAQFLLSRGIDVTTGVLENRCRTLNQAFIKQVTTGLPFVVLKAAATLDGHIATRTGDARWISNERSRRFVHRLRHDLDAILIGSGTALADDPMLTARLSKKRIHQPVRIVLDTKLRLPFSSQLLRTAKDVPVWIACSNRVATERMDEYRERGAIVIPVPTTDDRIDLRALLYELGRRNITSVLVEGGAKVFGSFIDASLADMGYLFYAPKIIGDGQAMPMISGMARLSMSEVMEVYNIRVRRFDNDVMLIVWFRPELY